MTVQLYAEPRIVRGPPGCICEAFGEEGVAPVFGAFAARACGVGLTLLPVLFGFGPNARPACGLELLPKTFFAGAVTAFAMT